MTGRGLTHVYHFSFRFGRRPSSKYGFAQSELQGFNNGTSANYAGVRRRRVEFAHHVGVYADTWSPAPIHGCLLLSEVTIHGQGRTPELTRLQRVFLHSKHSRGAHYFQRIFRRLQISTPVTVFLSSRTLRVITRTDVRREVTSHYGNRHRLWGLRYYRRYPPVFKCHSTLHHYVPHWRVTVHITTSTPYLFATVTTT